MDAVRLGVVGLGWFGGVLTESAKTSGAADVIACFARSEEARSAFADKHRCRPVSDLDEMLGDPMVEGVLLATPHSTHPDLAMRVIGAGKHVFVEKPLALTVADTKRVAEAAAQAEIVVQVGQNRRRQPANRRIKAMIETGQLGRVLQLEGTHTAPGGHKPDLPEWRRDPAECPFGGMTALGVHTVDTFHYFIGPARRVTAFSTRLQGFNDLDEATTVLLEYEAGPLATINTTYFAPPVVSLSVYGSDAAAWNEEDGRRLFTQARSEPVRSEQDVQALDTIADEIAEFARSIRERGRPETGIPEALEVAAVLEAVGLSLETGCSVDVAELR
jgi:predicted dehydrogenase